MWGAIAGERSPGQLVLLVSKTAALEAQCPASSDGLGSLKDYIGWEGVAGVDGAADWSQLLSTAHAWLGWCAFSCWCSMSQLPCSCRWECMHACRAAHAGTGLLASSPSAVSAAGSSAMVRPACRCPAAWQLVLLWTAAYL